MREGGGVISMEVGGVEVVVVVVSGGREEEEEEAEGETQGSVNPDAAVVVEVEEEG